MATIDFSSFRPLPTDYTFQGSEKVLVQPLGSREPMYMTWDRFTELVGSGGGGGTPVTTNPVLSPTSGTISIVFDGNKDYQPIELTGDATIESSGTVASTTKLIIDGGGFDLTLPAAWKNRAGLFDPEMRNSITVYMDANGIYEYTIFNDEIPDLVAPTLVSLSTNASGNIITATFSKDLAGTPNFTPGNFVIASQNIVGGSTVQIVPVTNIVVDQVITLSGGTALSNASGEAYFAGLTNQNITNNVSAVYSEYSYNAAALNQRLVSTANPANLALTIAGADQNRSVSCWFKWTDTNTLTFIFAFGYTDSAVVPFSAFFDGNDVLNVSVHGAGGATIGRFATSPQTALAGSWHHLCITKASTPANSTSINVYIDNVLLTTSDTFSGVYTVGSNFTANTRLIVGGYSMLSPNVATNIKVDHLVFYDKVLSSPERAAIYANGNANPTALSTEANVLGRYNFEQTGLDSGPNGYNLTSSVTPNYTTDVPL